MAATDNDDIELLGMKHGDQSKPTT
jgi:hypothetical protein